MEGIQESYDAMRRQGYRPQTMYVSPTAYKQMRERLSDQKRFLPGDDVIVQVSSDGLNWADARRFKFNGLDVVTDPNCPKDAMFWKQEYLCQFEPPKHPDGTPKRNYCREMLDKYMKDQERHALDSMVYGQSAMKVVWDEKKLDFTARNSWPNDW